VDEGLRFGIASFLEGGGKLVLSGTAALDPQTGEFGLEGVPVSYEGPAPTVPSYLRLDEVLAGDTELATDYDYVFYDRAHRVSPLGGAEAYGELRRALFDRTWEHFTSHAQAPVGDYLGSPIVVHNANVLYLAAPFFAAYRDHDYWVYREVALNAFRRFMPPPILRLRGPGWVEATLHAQPAAGDRPERRIVHLVAYHPRRTTQPVQHVDQSWNTSDLGVEVRTDGRTVERAYLAAGGEPLELSTRDGYARVDLPPIGTHAVVVLE
jgi:hypothetical protein